MWVLATKQASHTHKLFTAWVSEAKQASHTLKLFTAWVSEAKQASHTLKLFSVWVSATKQVTHTHKLFTLRRKGTEKLAPVTCAHAEAGEGYREACSCHLCPRWGRRRAQRSLLLSPVPTLRQRKGTEKLAPVTCAHAEEEEGYREACPCHLCPRWGGRRVQRSLFLSPVPTLRQKKGTGEVRLAGGKPALTMQVQYCSYIGL